MRCPLRCSIRSGLVPYYVGATLSAADARTMFGAGGFTVTATTALLHCPRALAIAVFGLMRRLAARGCRDASGPG